MKENKIPNTVFVVLLGLFIIYAVLRCIIILRFESAILLMLPVFSIGAFFYLKHQWREFYTVSEKLLVDLKANADSVSSFFKRKDK